MKTYEVLLISKDNQKYQVNIESENAFKAGREAENKINEKYSQIYEYKVKYVLDKEQNTYYYW